MTSTRRLLATALVAVLGPTLPVHAAREFSRGNITAVDWKFMQIEIRTPQGGLLTYKVAPNCSVKFTDKAADFANPRIEDLVPPMYIHFVFENQTMLEIDVREVGFDVQARGQTGDRDRTASGRPLKVRILRLDERRGTFDADVAGRRQQFRAETSRLLQGFRKDDLVILRVERRDGSDVVTAIRAAGQSGQVTEVDERRSEVRIDVRGRETLYQVDDPNLLRGLRVGDRVTFEVEELRGRTVITSIK